MDFEIPKVKRASEKSDLRPREFWCEEIFNWADGEVGETVLVMFCCDARHAAEEAAEYCEQQASEYCREHLIRVTDHKGVVSQWDVQGEQSIVYGATERMPPSPAPDGEA